MVVLNSFLHVCGWYNFFIEITVHIFCPFSNLSGCKLYYIFCSSDIVLILNYICILIYLFILFQFICLFKTGSHYVDLTVLKQIIETRLTMKSLRSAYFFLCFCLPNARIEGMQSYAQFEQVHFILNVFSCN